MDTMLEFARVTMKGGPLAYLIILLSVIALAIVLERFIIIRRARTNTDVFMQDIRDVLEENRLKEAITMCSRSPAAVARIIGAGLRKFGKSREEIREAIESAGKLEIGRLEKNLTGLATLGAIAPLLGFLGTVTGMIKAFRAIEMLAGRVDASILAGGIWEALVTTALGLAVSIPIIFAYNFLVSRVEKFVLDIEKSSSELIEILGSKGA